MKIIELLKNLFKRNSTRAGLAGLEAMWEFAGPILPGQPFSGDFFGPLEE
jgi:hypothetical protein